MAFILPGLDLPLFALMRTVVIQVFSVRRESSALLSQQRPPGQSFKSKSSIRGTRVHPRWEIIYLKNSFGEGAESNCFLVLFFPLHMEKLSVPKPCGCTPVLLGSSTGHESLA